MNLDKGAGRTVDETRVPENLKPLIPLVKKWGFKSLDDQDAFVKKMKRSRPAEVEAFARAVDAAHDEIRAWGLSLPHIGKHLSEYTDEDRTHPFAAFISMEKCREAVGWGGAPPPPELLATMERERQSKQYQQATQAADDSFRQKNYSEYVHLLSPFEDMLTPTQKTKLSIAKAKASV
jgi:hypothetical protein